MKIPERKLPQPRRIPPFVTLTLLALLAASPARAGDGRIPISSAPYVIAAPGHYYLTQSLTTAVAGSTTVTVGASDVDLDLNGFAIGNTGTGTTYGVSVGAFNDVMIHNGSLTGASYLVYQSLAAGTAANLRVERLRLYNTGTGAAVSVLATAPGVATGLVVADNQIYSPGPPALDLRGVSAGRVAGNVIRGGGTANLNISDSKTVEVTGNQLLGSGIGITLNNAPPGPSGHTLARNTLNGYLAGYAINLNGCQDNFILQNAIVGSGTGINVTNSSDGNVIEGNAIAGCGSGLRILPGGGTKNIYSNNRFANDPTAMQVTATGNQTGGGNCDGTTCS